MEPRSDDLPVVRDAHLDLDANAVHLSVTGRDDIRRSDPDRATDRGPFDHHNRRIGARPFDSRMVLARFTRDRRHGQLELDGIAQHRAFQIRREVERPDRRLSRYQNGRIRDRPDACDN